MKKGIVLLFFFQCIISCDAQKLILPLIPQPAELKTDTGFFTLLPETILFDSLSEFSSEIKAFNEQLNKYYGFSLPVSNRSNGQKVISLFHGHEGNRNMAEEEYVMRVSQTTISLNGYPEGVFRGLETLFQLINAQTNIKIPCLYIHDKPQFSWRGMHLDVCRHFFTKEEVKRYLDYLALYKFNVFHWHLTDDQGWRIEIKKYPLLTEKGSVRKETVIGKCSDSAKYDGTPYSGFYTQDDIREIVAYAGARHILVVPEIEMPGHALAALAAYPQFSCTGGPFDVGTTWGVFDDVYCPKPETFRFLEDVLTEVMELFPGPYIHIGGDECVKKRWKTCPNCQALMKKEGLKTENELQSYFIRTMEKFLNSKGKQLIGWDEILEGGLAPNAIVMSWRGMEGGILAAQLKHQVVMTPGKPCYFDHYQNKDRSKEPLAIGGYNPLENVYAYNPVPAKLPAGEKKYILGAQGNVWTEYITTFKQVEYMSVPRMCALAEALWTPPASKGYAGFVERLKRHSQLLDRMQVNYATHFKEKMQGSKP
jgi:hexosaminidase